MTGTTKPASEKQLGLLRCFGRSAASAREAHEAIDEIGRLSPAEQARLRVQQMEAAIAGSGGHNATFHVACVLVHGYGLSQSEALPIMMEYNARCQPPWSERDLIYKLGSAERAVHENVRGHLIVECNRDSAERPRPAAPVAPVKSSAQAAAPLSPRKLSLEFDYGKLRQVAGRWQEMANLEWLANRSAQDPCTVSAKRYLEMLYRPGEKVLLFTVFRSQGQAFWPVDEVPAAGEEGVWYLAQPVNGLTLPNPRNGKMSRRSQESVTEFRYVVLETDKVDDLPQEERAAYIRAWLGLIVQLPLRIEAIYTSGGKSVHALVRVDCRTHREWEEYVSALRPTINLLGMAGLDPAALTSVRLTRLPGCLRAGRLQKLLYVQPGAGVRRICDLEPMRDVAGDWLAKYARVVDGYEDSSRELRRALWYYAPCNQAVRAAERELDTAESTRA